MDMQEYRRVGKEMVDYIADYLENIRSRRVFPDVKPGYMRNLLPTHAPQKGEPWTDIFRDIEDVIMPGVTHWQSPHMHAYFPALHSPPSLLGDMLADGIGCLGFTWASSPACTELETIVMDWLAQMLGLPDEFLHVRSVSKGGGVIQTTSSEATFVALLAARTEAIRRCHEGSLDLDDADLNGRLVAYCSDQAHSSVEKAGLIGLVKMHYVESDENLSLRGHDLKEAMDRDRAKGLLPFYVCATLGTTGACAFDNLQEIGEICAEERVWLHVDAAYAGSAFVCPEFRHWLRGIQYADSFAFNPSKWLMVHFDCTAMWVRNSTALHRLAVDYMHWQIPLSKRFRSLKLWFVLRTYGVEGLQSHIRKGVELAQLFEDLVRSDKRFEIPAPRHLGLVVIRLKGPNAWTEKLLKRLNANGKLHCVPAALKGKYVIRFTVTSPHTTAEDIRRDWSVIQATALDVAPHKVSLAEIKKHDPDFGTSLLLANSPMTPKVVNGSFVALFEGDDALRGLLSRMGDQFALTTKDSPALRRRVRGLMLSQKQYSLDSRMDLMSSMAASSPGGRPTTNDEAEDEAEVHNGKDTTLSQTITEDDEDPFKLSQNEPKLSSKNEQASLSGTRSKSAQKLSE